MRRILYFCLSILTLLAGVWILKNPQYTLVRGTAGDILVVCLMFFLFKILRDFESKKLAALLFLFACFVESLQYFHFADWLGLERGLLRTMLGSTFDFADIAAYLAGAVFSVLVDRVVIAYSA
ncbi:MAG TPA: DUF2809 domain-containing protein [Leptospiraceae bacterium]|nr:DUF2809 domain-containing protein [Leptospirales bacterium]HMX55117.1 DUF2809 domain-containing protein [Leptospiraceae bacterium]HMZ36444.1 DUF2809 domain-containing protein [Leptospiraceae bacterium]HNE25384.1 DUF2809 domain-containing protein [Leptospiraceae bacterium]HNJ02916.1 DUF2809 domain-containing protein [Leptospiraceae bacterium]